MNEAVRPRWDFFISYPSTEEETARALYSLLSPHARTSLSNQLEAGEKWPIVLDERLRSSQCTVVLVSDTPTTSHNYYQEEITRAVSLNAATAGIHKVVPVVLSDRVKSLPFGLAIFQALDVGRHGDLSRIAKSLRELISRSAWEGYAGGLFTLDGYRLAYLPLPNASSLDIQQPGAREIEVIRDMTHTYC